METNRLEAFSDGVIAIIITIMVLELKVPEHADVEALLAQAPIFGSYLLSFVVVAIMWVNHHYFLHRVREVRPRILWANMGLLFWMSLIPFATSYIGESSMSPLALAVYSFILAACSLAFLVLQIGIEAAPQRQLSEKLPYEPNLLISLGTALAYLVGAGAAFLSPWITIVILIVLPLLFFVPGLIKRTPTQTTPEVAH